MSLFTCNECNREISDKAKACPHCGAPVANQNDVLIHEQEKPASLVKNIGSILYNLIDLTIVIILGSVGVLLLITIGSSALIIYTVVMFVWVIVKAFMIDTVIKRR
jgi:hypothetical protein